VVLLTVSNILLIAPRGIKKRKIPTEVRLITIPEKVELLSLFHK